MLTLTRSDGDMIVLTDARTGERTLIRIDRKRRPGGGWQASVSIQAPPHVRIDRAEKMLSRSLVVMPDRPKRSPLNEVHRA